MNLRERESFLLYLWGNMRHQFCVYSSCRDGLFFKLYFFSLRFGRQRLFVSKTSVLLFVSGCQPPAGNKDWFMQMAMAVLSLSLSQPQQHILHNLLSAVSGRIKYFYQMRTQRLTHHHAETYLHTEHLYPLTMAFICLNL